VCANVFAKEMDMLRMTTFSAAALLATLAVAGCNQKTPEAQQQDQQKSEIATQPAPNAAERVAAGAANEVEQASGSTATITPSELAAGLNARDVPNPATSLSTASVKTTDGQTVGEVRSVVVGASGKADAIHVEVGGFLNVGERAVSIEAQKFTFLKDRNILVVSLAKSDIEKLPVAPK
jgi:hypothetical protein